MNCPFRVNEIHDVRNSEVTKVNLEFGECYGVQCPYWGLLKSSPYREMDGCRKAEKEVI